MTSRSGRTRWGAACALLVAGLVAWPAAAEESLGMTVGTGLANLVYLPVKVAYAAGGTAVGGLAWVFSGGRSDVAKEVALPSLRGDYVLTPDHLRGERPIVFVGRDAMAPEPVAEPEAESPWPEETDWGAEATDWGAEETAWGDEGRWEEAEIPPAAPPEPAELPGEDDFWNPREPEEEPVREPAPRTAPDPAPAPARAPAPDWDRRAPVRAEVLPPVAAPPPARRAPAAAAPPPASEPPARVGPPPVWVYEPAHRGGGP